MKLSFLIVGCTMLPVCMLAAKMPLAYSQNQDVSGRPVLQAMKAGLYKIDATETLLVQVHYDSLLQPEYSISNTSVRSRKGIGEIQVWNLVLSRSGKGNEQEWRGRFAKDKPQMIINKHLSDAVLKVLTFLEVRGDLKLPIVIEARTKDSFFIVSVLTVPLTPDRSRVFKIVNGQVIQI